MVDLLTIYTAHFFFVYLISDIKKNKYIFHNSNSN